MSLFDQALPSKKLDVFHVALVGRTSRNWEELFTGFDSFRGLTFSSSLAALVRLAGLFGDMEITFGSERILLREHEALEAARTRRRSRRRWRGISTGRPGSSCRVSSMGRSASGSCARRRAMRSFTC